MLGWFLPLGGALQVLSIVPIALLASRHRARAAIVATCAVGAAGFVVGGLGLLVQAWLYGSLGLSVGLARRRGGGPLVALSLAMLTTGLPAAGGSLALAAAFPSLRKLLLAQVNLYGRGVARVLSNLGARRPGRDVVNALTWINNHWWFTYPGFEIVAIGLIAGFATRYLTPLLDRLARDAPAARRGLLAPAGAGVGAAAGAGVLAAPQGSGRAFRRHGAETTPTTAAHAAVGPVPVALRDVSYRYPAAERDAVQGISLEVVAGDLVVLVGPNGSGKSTLARLLAGLPPTAGSVERPGDAGLGRAGGTAIVFQRPESQVLGVRVRDDLVWGLPASVPCDVPELLGRVGLDGMADRETSTLSGGELQRLAIASALARHPRLVISDESTSMLDTEGQRAVVKLLGELSRSDVAVVHVTHRALDGAGATKRLRLTGLPAPVAPSVPEPAPAVTVGAGEHSPRLREPAAVVLEGVGHVYAAGTPWAHRALAGVDLRIEPGEGVVVAGANGSGKSTLAWVIGGLVVPSEGTALVGGEPASTKIGQVGIGFQHARLQMLRATALADVAYGADDATARDALARVGLDVAGVGGRRVDELSGGEQRRVALAGILARSPILVVLDEPLAGLDEETRTTLESVLRRLRREQGVATIVIAHDLAVATGLGERLITLSQARVAGDDPMPVPKGSPT